MGVPRWGIAAAALLMLSTLSTTAAFTLPSQHLSQPRVTALAAHKNEPTPSFENRSSETTPSNNPSPSRRTFLSKIAGTSSVIIFSGTAQSAFAEGEETSDPAESIVARAARVSQEVKEAETAQQGAEEERRRELAQKLRDDPRSIYDFTLPVNGKAREVAELLGQTFGEGDGGDGWTDGGENGTNAAEGRLGTRVKAILVVNMKQDDPIARKNIPELLELITK